MRRWLVAVRGPAGWTALVLVLSATAVAYPLAHAPHPPLVDYPGFEAIVAGLHGQGREAYWSTLFRVDYSSAQYLLVYVAGDVLASVLGVSGACRAIVVIAVAALPLAVALYLRAHGRPALGGAAAACVAIHAYTMWGFVSYIVAMPLALAALAALAALVRTPSRWRAALLAALALALFYAHPQLYAWFAIAALVQTAAMLSSAGRARVARSIFLAALAAVPSVVAFGVWVRASGILERGVASQRDGLAQAVRDEPPVFEPVPVAVRHALDHSVAVYRDGTGETVALAFAAGVLGLVAARGRADGGARMDEGASASRDDYAPELVLAATLTEWLFAPQRYRAIEPIAARFLPLALALVPVLGPLRDPGRRARGALGIGLIAAALYAGNVHASRFAALETELGGLDLALAHTAPGRRLLGLVHDRDSEVVPYPVHMHVHQYYQSRVGGLAEFSFVEFPMSPLRFQDGIAPDPPFPRRFEWTPERFRWETWGAAYDYVLVRTAPGRSFPPFHPPGVRPAPRLVYEDDRWHLYAVGRAGSER